MINLTPHILSAARRGRGYDLGTVVECLSRRLAGQAVRVKWDDGAGEDWATITLVSQRLIAEKWAAIVWRRGPLAIVVSELSENIVALLVENQIEVLSVADFDHPVARVDGAAVPVLKDTAPWPDEVPLDCMSIADLYWATV